MKRWHAAASASHAHSAANSRLGNTDYSKLIRYDDYCQGVVFTGFFLKLAFSVLFGLKLSIIL